ncbi:Piso0_002331 [Millerozyma farinosa CBS 7064]|uniref:Piso0_002331 protein n=1 Tax=Pichia sorbitophila (strain ATCC MYA-4447 / BCRC 22081 / CBS 7064 / NBRC 10061 / NRRL Y-12695) TaxID=559304 RepID=G8YER9_PICSO|nr:Piso0_002331 [Millerozyma farinosa CBS 7064]
MGDNDDTVDDVHTAESGSVTPYVPLNDYSDNQSVTPSEKDRHYTQGPLDDTFGQHPVFPLSSSLRQETSVSREVMEYISEVRLEARNDAPVHFVSKDESTPNEDISRHEDMRLTQTVEQNSREATEWQESVSNQFLGLKEHIASYITERKQSLEQARKEAQSSYQVCSTSAEWRKLILNEPPPSIDFFYFCIVHSDVIKLVIYSTKWLSSNVTSNLSKWIFVLLLRLDSTLDHNDCAVVRDLAKKALKIKEKGSAQLNETTTFTLDFIIYIVATYFGQKDLI